MRNRSATNSFFEIAGRSDGKPYLTLLNQLPFGISALDSQQNFVFANSAFCDHFQLAESDILQRSPAELQLKPLMAIPEPVSRHASEVGNGAHKTYCRNIDGNDQCLNLSFHPLQLDNDRYTLVTSIDLTFLHIIPAVSPSVSEERFNRLFEASPVPMGYAFEEDDYRSSRWNASWHQTFGYSPEETAGKSGNDLGLWASPGQRMEFIGVCKRDGLITNYEAQLRCADGTVKDCELFGRFIGDSKRQILAVIYLDVTEKKQVQTAVRDSEELFSKLFMLSPVAMLVTELESGRVVDVNEQWRKLTRCSREETIGVKLSDLNLVMDPDAFSVVIREIEDTGAVREYPLELQDRQGEIRDVLCSGEIILLKGKKVVLSTFYDITLRKRAETENKQLQQQLAQMQKFESVGQLAGGVAHDFNNILGVILGNAELAMLKVGKDNAVYQHLETIHRAGKRSAEITQQLLAFARKQAIAPKTVDLKIAIEDTLQMLRYLIGENITLVFSPGDEPYPVRIDPSQLDQMLVNVCVNSRDAIQGNGSIYIELKTSQFDESSKPLKSYVQPGEYVCLTISDTGCGMAGDVLEKIFDPFFTTKGVGQGTGLGLATVYGIIKQNDGFINAYSEPGKGTSFHIFLPRMSGDGGYFIADRQETARIHGGDEIVLLVEDEQQLLTVGYDMLSRLGYKVFTAEKPSEALVIARSHSIDLLITDLIMPEMDGRELECRLRPSNPDMACLFISGYTANIISHHGVLNDGVCFLQKPFSLHELARKVREALGSR